MQAHFAVSKLPPFWQLITVQPADVAGAVGAVDIMVVGIVVIGAALVEHFPHNAGQYVATNDCAQSATEKVFGSLHLIGSLAQFKVSQRVPVYDGKQSHLHVVGFCLAPLRHESTCGHDAPVVVVGVAKVVVVAVATVSQRVPVKPVGQKHWHVDARKKPPL